MTSDFVGQHGHICDRCGATWLHYEAACRDEPESDCPDCADADDCFQPCECLRQCRSEAFTICRACLRWVCPQCEPSEHHGCEVSIDEQRRDRSELLKLMAGRESRRFQES